jgi:hypothetical protein
LQGVLAGVSAGGVIVRLLPLWEYFIFTWLPNKETEGFPLTPLTVIGFVGNFVQITYKSFPFAVKKAEMSGWLLVTSHAVVS